MLCALTKPLFEASTDFGAIEPVIVLTSAIFFDDESSWLYAGLIGPTVAVMSRQDEASDNFQISFLGTRSLYWL
jgi:hypothetical protein